MAAEPDGCAPFTVTATARGGTVTISLHGGLDSTTAAIVHRQLGPVLDQRPDALVFDLAELLFMDCAGARMLARARLALPPGRRPALRAPRPIVLRLLRLTGLDRQFSIEPARRPAPRRPRGGPVADIAAQIAGEHERIASLFAGLEGTARYAGPGRPDGGPDWILAAMWARIVPVLEVHADAAQEICYPVVFGRRTGLAGDREAAVTGLGDLREALAEARLQPAGSPAWWRAVTAARTAASAHIALLDRALPVFEHIHSEHRDRLSRQWEAFMSARHHDARGERAARTPSGALRNVASRSRRVLSLVRR